MILYNKQDFSLLENDFPDLYYDENDNTVKGELSFNAYYKNIGKKCKDRWRICLCSESDNCLHGYYEIKICLITNPPTVYEISGKIKKLAEKLERSNNDLHLYDDYKCCLGLGINCNIPLSTFIINWVYPYFIWQAYFEKYEKVPPCGEYPHNEQEAGEQYWKDVKNLGRNELCICGSGKKYKNCCLKNQH